PRQQARRELGPIEGRLRLFQFAAGLVPLTGGILLVGVRGGGQFTLGFRLLLIGLIGPGMAGFCAAFLASSRLTPPLRVLVGASSRSPQPRGGNSQPVSAVTADDKRAVPGGR